MHFGHGLGHVRHFHVPACADPLSAAAASVFTLEMTGTELDALRNVSNPRTADTIRVLLSTKMRRDPARNHCTDAVKAVMAQATAWAEAGEPGIDDGTAAAAVPAWQTACATLIKEALPRTTASLFGSNEHAWVQFWYGLQSFAYLMAPVVTSLDGCVCLALCWMCTSSL